MSKLTIEDIKKHVGPNGYKKPNVLRTLYSDMGFNQSTLADIFDVSSSTISYWLDKCDIAKRNTKPGGHKIAEKVIRLERELSALRQGKDEITFMVAGRPITHEVTVLKVRARIRDALDDAEHPAVKEKLEALYRRCKQLHG